MVKLLDGNDLNRHRATGMQCNEPSTLYVIRYDIKQHWNKSGVCVLLVQKLDYSLWHADITFMNS